MKANTTINFKYFSKAIAFFALMVIAGTLHAQTPAVPLEGGQTYWIDGVGQDLVLPKDTFKNLTGTNADVTIYKDSTGIITALNLKGLNPLSLNTVTILLASGYSGVEPNVITIGVAGGGYDFMNDQRPIVIKPVAGLSFNITSTTPIPTNGALLRFNGAWNVTIDGESVVGQRNLTFSIPASTPIGNVVKVVDFIATVANGCQNLAVKNCNLLGTSKGVTMNGTTPVPAAIYTYAGFYLGGTATPSNAARPSRNISIINNTIGAVKYGVYMRGMETPSNKQDDGIIIKGNIIGGTIPPQTPDSLATTYIGGVDGAAGVYLLGQKNTLVEGNTIRNNFASFGNFRGIQLTNSSTTAISLDSNITINANQIYNLRSITGAAGGVYGIRYTMSLAAAQQHAQPLAIKITNNTIGNIISSVTNNALTGLANIVGIHIEDNTANVGLSVINNSIHLYGDTLNLSAVSACLVTTSGVTGGVTASNNIFVNRLGRTLTTTGQAPTSYIYMVNSPNSPFSSMRNNAYHVNNTSGAFSFIGNIGSSNRASMETWRAKVADIGSFLTIPPFVATNDSLCRITNGAGTVLGSAGVPVTGVTKDINGVTRNSTNPSVGAYEFTGNTSNANYTLKAGKKYLINGTSSWPVGNAGATGSFATLAEAVTYLNSYGVAGNGKVNLQFTSSYTGETTLIPQLLHYPGANANCQVLIDVAPSTSITVTTPVTANTNIPNQFALLNLIAAKFVSINGSSTPGQRNLTFALPGILNNTNIKVIALTATESDSITDVSISNCNIVGASTKSGSTAITTACGIYHGGYNPGTNFVSANIGNSKNITISNNYIQAVRTGIYMRGADIFTGHTKNVTIYRNTIGGDIGRGKDLPLTYIGGSTNQAGIMLKGISASLVDSNIIRNCDDSSNLSLGFRGIDLDLQGDTKAVDSLLVISRNTIYNLTNKSTAAGTYCFGIRVSLGGATLRSIQISNNSIAKIQGTGSSSIGAINNPTGILIDGTGTITALGLDIINNTVQLTGTTLTGTNASACLFLGGSIQGGVRVMNNIFTNRLGRATFAAGSNAYAVYSAATTSTTLPFALNTGGEINGNSYGVDAPNTANNYLVAAGTAPQSFIFVKQWQTFANQDEGSYGFVASFLNDSLPLINTKLAGQLFNSSVKDLSVQIDIAGNPRVGLQTSAGALLFVMDYLPLTGDHTYLINGLDSFPTTLTGNYSFATISSAINYLNANGVDPASPQEKRITLKISTGYTGEPTDAFIPVIRPYPNMNSSRFVSLTTSPGRSDTIRTAKAMLYPAHGSVIRFLGGSNFEIDGNNGSGGRAITIMLPDTANPNAATLRLVDLAPADKAVTNVRIRNCNLIGTSIGDSNLTYAAIYTGGILATPSVPTSGANGGHLFENNFIGAVKYGVYATGVILGGGQQDKGVVIKRNIIGSNGTINGNTLNWGGVAGNAGIFMSSQIMASIDSNVISYNIAKFANNRGIELSSVTGATTLSVDSAISITRNTINNIRNTSATGGAYGIYLNFADPAITPTGNRAFMIANNMISAITAPGTAAAPTTAFSPLSPIGIYVEGATAINNLGLNIWSNSINLGYGNSLSAANSVSSCVAFSANIRGGVTLQSNILQNRLGRASGSGSSATSVLVGHTANIFSVTDNNIYYTDAPFSTNSIAIYNYANATPVKYDLLSNYASFTRQDTMSINFITKFISDTNLLLDGNVHNAYDWGAKLPLTVDIQGEPRNPLLRSTIGADELDQTLASTVDSIAPKVFNITSLPLFCPSDADPINIVYRVFERTTGIASDTLYYTVNSGPEQFVVGATAVSDFTRTYQIPPQSYNSSVAYRLAVTDLSYASFRTVFPVSGSSYTSTAYTQFPIADGWDLPNVHGWTVDNNTQAGPSPAGWDLNSFGSPNFPVLLPKTGVKAALFPAATLPNGAVSRLVSPCLDFTNLKVPTIRIWVSQNDGSLANADAVQIVASGGLNQWVQLASVVRPNGNLSFPEYTQIDVCLSTYAGLNSIRLGIEGVSKAGNNIVLDSIVIFDDVLNQPVTPLTNTICTYNPLVLNIPASSSTYAYKLVDVSNGASLGSEILGNGGPLSVTAPNPSVPNVRRVDVVKTILKYRNTLSGCVWQMADTATINIKNFFNGPFITKGVPFDGFYSGGKLNTPDGTKLGDVLTYTLTPPSGYSNTEYGTQWTIVSAQTATPLGENPITSSVFTAPNPTTNTNGYVTVTPQINDVDSVFKLAVTYRLLPTGCDSVATRYVKVTSAPTASFTNISDSVCAGAVITFTNTTQAADNTTPITYYWTFGDGTVAYSRDVDKVYSFDVAAGMYTVTLVSTNNAGVTDTTFKQIRVLPAPVTSYTTTLACGNAQTQFTNTTTGGTSYAWTVKLNNQTTATSTQTDPQFSFAITDTIYNVTLRATNTLGCFRDSTTGVFAFPQPVPMFTAANVCSGKNVQFNNQTTIGNGSSSHQNTFGSIWELGNGDTVLSNSPTYKYPAGGTYTVKLKVTSNYGCMDSTTKQVIVYDKPNSGFTMGVACQEEIVTINNTTTYGGTASDKVLYTWDFGDFSPLSTAFNPIKSYGVKGNYTVQLITHDTVHFCYDTTSKAIVVNDVPIAQFTGDNGGCVNQDVEFSNGSIAPDGEILTYVWNFGDNTTSIATSPSHAFAGSGKFGVTLKATTNNGCSNEITDSIVIDAKPNSTFSVDSIDCYTLRLEANVEGYPTYAWFVDGLFLGSTGDSVNYLFQRKGLHAIRLTVTSTNGCTSTDSTFDDSTWCSVGIEDLFESKFNLSVYPNPFEDVANISYNLDSKQNVTVTVMDMLGRKVAEINENNQTAGNHVIKLNDTHFTGSTAMYMVRIQIGDEAITKQLLRK
jgi:PKD repeat protein